VLPQHLENRDFLVLAPRDGDVDAPRHCAPDIRQALLDGVGDDDLPGLGLARHAIRGVHRRTENVDFVTFGC